MHFQKVLQVTKDARKQVVADELTELDTDKHAVMNMSCTMPPNQGKLNSIFYLWEEKSKSKTNITIISDETKPYEVDGVRRT